MATRSITDAEYWRGNLRFSFICADCGQQNAVDTFAEPWVCYCGWNVVEPEVDPRLSLTTAERADLDRLVRACGYMRRGNEEDEALRERVLQAIR